jgi:hypothetical protein
MAQSSIDLAELFGAALKSVTAHRQEINDLDGYNGNHGDNMVENVQMIVDALQRKQTAPPADALEYASGVLQENGRGGTSQYYAKGLGQAAEQVRGHDSLDQNDVMSVVESILGAIPSQRQQEQPQAGGSVLEQVLEMARGGQPQAGAQDDGLDLGDVLSALLPAGLAFLQAKQAGADTAEALNQALMGALMGARSVDPLQSGSSRAAAGGLIAQSILQALTGGR